MAWKSVILGDHCTITSSKRFHASERTTTGVPFYCSKEIIQKVHGEDVTECDYISDEAYENVKIEYGVPETGDLLITSRGTYGVPYLYRNSDKFYFADGNLTWLKDFDEELDAKYFFYWVQSYEGQQKIDAIAKGTAQKAIPISTLKTVELTIPDSTTQKKIASILSAYEDLIENNQKQIKLLEEAAQRLYKEWFVDLRFPGHEHVKIVDGVPEGWEKNRADSFFDITIGKTPSRSEQYLFTSGNKGVPWVSISDMGKSGTFIYSTDEGLTREAINNFNVKVVPAGTILVSFKLTVGRVSIVSSDMATNEAIAHFYIEDDLFRSYTYCYLKNFKYDTLGNTSSISKAVNSKIIKAMPFIMPDKNTVEKFSMQVKPLLDGIKNKQNSIILLQEARDRLLPKLISGEIQV